MSFEARIIPSQNPQTGVENFSSIYAQSHRIGSEFLEPLKNREHMARPYPAMDFDFLAINVPSTYQQGLIPDGEEPPWGMLRVVASARELSGLNAGVLDAHRLKLLPEDIQDQIKKTGAKLIGINPTSVNVPEAQAIAEICDELGVDYIVGGIHATLDPQVARMDFPNARAIVRGNGEAVIGDLVNDILSGNSRLAPGVLMREGEYLGLIPYAKKMNPGTIPMVNQQELVEEPVYRHTVTINGEKKEIAEATLFVTEGCPFECTFCASPVMVNRGAQGSVPYSRPPMERILDEVDHCANDLGADSIHFLDDMAFVTESHLTDLYQGMKDRDLLDRVRWRGLTRAPVIDRFSDVAMERMRESGAWKIALGVESGSDAVLESILKKVSTDEVRRAVSRLTKYGIQTKGFFIMGFPDETEEQIQQTKDFIRELKDRGMSEAAVFQFKPYPGTAEYRNLVYKRPEIVPQLTYLRRSGTELTGKAKYRVEQHDTWLPDNLRIAEVPSGRVREHVTEALQEFYGEEYIGEAKSDCI